MKHAANSVSSSFAITHACVERSVTRGFIGHNPLALTKRPFGMYAVEETELLCLGGIVLTVSKEYTPVALPFDPNDPLVVTTGYSYNASIRGHYNFLRYDNAHSWPKHVDEHHRHELHWSMDERSQAGGKVTWVGAANFPHLSEFIEEVESWYWSNRTSLPNPAAFATPGGRAKGAP